MNSFFICEFHCTVDSRRDRLIASGSLDCHRLKSLIVRCRAYTYSITPGHAYRATYDVPDSNAPMSSQFDVCNYARTLRQLRVNYATFLRLFGVYTCASIWRQFCVNFVSIRRQFCFIEEQRILTIFLRNNQKLLHEISILHSNII